MPGVPVKPWLHFGLGLCLVGLAQAQQVEVVQLSQSASPQVYEKFELSFSITPNIAPPDAFDPGQIDMRATFRYTPAGETTEIEEVVPAFYHGDPVNPWRVRYSPRHAVNHTWQLRDFGNQTFLDQGSFVAAAPSANRGFLYRDGAHLEDSHGRRFTILGHNLPWEDLEESTAAIQQMSDHKINWFRLWGQCQWGSYNLEAATIETTPDGQPYGGMGDYQLSHAANLDELYSFCEASGVYVMYVWQNHWDFKQVENGSDHWEDNAYNIDDGGPCCYVLDGDPCSVYPTNYWVLEEGGSLTEQGEFQLRHLRYVFARYGYSRAFSMLQYWNECDSSSVRPENSLIEDWHALMDEEWKAWDFYDRPTSTSFAWRDHAEPGENPWTELGYLDAAPPHRYYVESDIEEMWVEQIDHTQASHPGIVFLGEVGPLFDPNDNPTNYEASVENTERYTHDCIWVPIFHANAAGSNLMWDDSKTDTPFDGTANTRDYMEIAADLIQPFEGELKTMTHVFDPDAPQNTSIGYFRRPDSLLLYVNDQDSSFLDAQANAVSSFSYSVAGMAPNTTFEFRKLNTYTGATSEFGSFTSDGAGNLELTVPSFTRDMAIVGGSNGQPPTCLDVAWVNPLDGMVFDLNGSDFPMTLEATADCCDSGPEETTCESFRFERYQHLKIATQGTENIWQPDPGINFDLYNYLEITFIPSAGWENLEVETTGASIPLGELQGNCSGASMEPCTVQIPVNGPFSQVDFFNNSGEQIEFCLIRLELRGSGEATHLWYEAGSPDNVIAPNGPESEILTVGGGGGSPCDLALDFTVEGTSMGSTSCQGGSVCSAPILWDPTAAGVYNLIVCATNPATGEVACDEITVVVEDEVTQECDQLVIQGSGWSHFVVGHPEASNVWQVPPTYSDTGWTSATIVIDMLEGDLAEQTVRFKGKGASVTRELRDGTATECGVSFTVDIPSDTSIINISFPGIGDEFTLAIHSVELTGGGMSMVWYDANVLPHTNFSYPLNWIVTAP